MVIERIEAMCGLPLGALCARAFATSPMLLLQPPAAIIPYRQFHSYITQNRELDYYLRPLPAQLHKVFAELLEWKKAERHFINGKWIPVLKKERWGKPSSVKIHLAEVRSFFGFLLLPKALPDSEIPADLPAFLGATPAERIKRYKAMRIGMGMKVEDLRFTMLIDHVLAEKYVLFRRARNEQEGTIENVVATIIHWAGLVIQSKPIAFFPNHPKFGIELTPKVSSKKWLDWCELQHSQMRNLINTLNKNVLKRNTRKADDPVKHVFAERDPLAVMTQLGHHLLETLPPLSNRTDRALQFRNGMIILLMLYEPLRASHWPFLELGKQIIKDPNSGRWGIHILATEFKNYIYGHAQDRNRVLPESLSAVVDIYVEEYRTMLHCPLDETTKEKTKIFLLKARTGDSIRKNPLPTLTENGFYNLFANIIEKYLGIPVGPHVIRHIVATAWLREHPGDWVTVAAILNDSVETVRQKYDHTTQPQILERRDEKFEITLNAKRLG